MSDVKIGAKTLLVFDENPEKISFFVIDSASPIAQQARLVAGKYMNSDELTKKEEKAPTAVSEWMVSTEGKAARLDNKKVMEVRVQEVIHFGFAL